MVLSARGSTSQLTPEVAGEDSLDDSASCYGYDYLYHGQQWHGLFAHVTAIAPLHLGVRSVVRTNGVRSTNHIFNLTAGGVKGSETGTQLVIIRLRALLPRPTVSPLPSDKLAASPFRFL